MRQLQVQMQQATSNIGSLGRQAELIFRRQVIIKTKSHQSGIDMEKHSKNSYGRFLECNNEAMIQFKRKQLDQLKIDVLPY